MSKHQVVCATKAEADVPDAIIHRASVPAGNPGSQAAAFAVYDTKSQYRALESAMTKTIASLHEGNGLCPHGLQGIAVVLCVVNSNAACGSGVSAGTTVLLGETVLLCL